MILTCCLFAAHRHHIVSDCVAARLRAARHIFMQTLGPCAPQFVSRECPGEELLFLVALAAGAQLMFADTPKHILFQRLCNLPSGG